MTRRLMKTVSPAALAGCVCLTAAHASHAAVIHVKADATGANDGTSWADAFMELQDALSAAQSGDEIWVAAGTYTPAPPNGPRTRSFELKDAVGLYGGFAGRETAREQRDPVANVTTLSGDLNRDDGHVSNTHDLLTEPTRAENSYHVVTAAVVGPTTSLDGFTITAGHANGSVSGIDGFGGGMFISNGNPMIKDCTFDGNTAAGSGGGIWNIDSSPTLIRCKFVANAADNGGGMAHHPSGIPILRNCTFVANVAEGNGGGLSSDNGELTLIRCAFVENTSNGSGGAVEGFRARLTFVETEFVRNRASDAGGGVVALGTPMTLRQCAFNGNVAGEGGGLSISSETHEISKCTFRDNQATSLGGAISNDSTEATVRLVDCNLARNRAAQGGGALENSGGKFTLINSVFVANAGKQGGAVINQFGRLAVINCTFAGNTAGDSGGGVVRSNSPIVITNSIVWNNESPVDAAIAAAADVTYSTIEGGWEGDGNVDVDPHFVRNPDDGGDGWGDNPDTPDVDEGANDDFGDLRLLGDSPCIDAGNSDARIPTSVSGGGSRRGGGGGDAGEDLPATDLDGHPRKIDDWCTADTGNGIAPIVDMGAFEFVPPHGDADCDDDVDLVDFLSFAACVSGPSTPAVSGCGAFDFDHDRDVDLADLVAFQSAITDSR